MHCINQELSAYIVAVQKACAAYYGPAVPEPKGPAVPGKPRTPAAAADAAASLLPSSEGPGAITRPACIMPNAAEMEKHCAGKVELQRSEAHALVLQASGILQKQVIMLRFVHALLCMLCRDPVPIAPPAQSFGGNQAIPVKAGSEARDVRMTAQATDQLAIVLSTSFAAHIRISPVLLPWHSETLPSIIKGCCIKRHDQLTN